MVTARTIYTAKDGREFHAEGDARRHEGHLLLMEFSRHFEDPEMARRFIEEVKRNPKQLYLALNLYLNLDAGPDFWAEWNRPT